MTSNPAVSIIIRSFNEEKHVGKLLEGVCRQTIYPDIEIILVDSGSTDQTINIAKEKGVKILQILPEEFSFGRALNKGCSLAQGQFLLFASAHVYPVYSNWIEKIIAPFKDENVGLVYGRQIGNEITKYSEKQIFNKWFPAQSNYDQKTPFCNNANAVIRKSLWKEQQFDESLTGLEDVDFALKALNKGYKIAYEAGAPIVHVHEETNSKIKNRYKREAIALKKIVPRQSLSFAAFVKLLVSNIVNDSYHAIHDKLFLKNFLSIIQFRSMQFFGTYQGLNYNDEITDQLKERFYYPNALKKKTSETEHGEKIIYSGGLDERINSV